MGRRKNNGLAGSGFDTFFREWGAEVVDVVIYVHGDFVHVESGGELTELKAGWRKNQSMFAECW